MRSLLLILCFSLTVSAWAQSSGRKHRDIFPSFGEYQRRGWVISPLLTYAPPAMKSSPQRVFPGNDEVYDIRFNPAGRVGIGLEVGRFNMTDNLRHIHSVEFGIGVKTFRAVERFEAMLDDPNRVNPFVLRGDGDFQLNYATASIRVNNVKQFSDYSFLINSIGINADYLFSSNMRYNDRGLPISLLDPQSFLLQANYRIGFGFKLTKSLVAVPSLETPLITALPFDDFKSSLHVFNSRYRPIVLRISFLLLDKKSARKCPSKGRSNNKRENLFGMTQRGNPW